MPYRLYLDESGTDDVTHCDEEKHRYLGLTGVIIRQDHSRDFCVPEVAQIKRDIFAHDPDSPPCLHREDIIGYKREFSILRDAAVRAKFDAAILKFMGDAEYTVITAVIDKLGMLKKRNWVNKEPYLYLMEIMAEKYALFLKRKNDVGDIMPEMRRGRADKELQSAYLKAWQTGTNFAPRVLMQARLPAKHLKFRDKRANVAGLELADLLAHPSALYVRQDMGHAVKPGPFALKVFDVLSKTKYDRSVYDVVKGYGTKYLP